MATNVLVWFNVQWPINTRFGATNWHSFWRHGQPYYEYPSHVLSYPKCHELFDCTVDKSTLCHWVDQGEGFTVKLLQYPRRNVLKWKELCNTDLVESWQLADCSTKLNEWDFGRSCKITSVVVKFESKLKSVDGDVQQTTSLLLVYYQKQSHCLLLIYNT
jgi:hypothetical protein